MSKLSVTDEVNNNVVVEFLSILSSGTEDHGDILHRISIYMEDWSTDSLSQIRAVSCRSSLVWSGGETNLVVHDHVNGTSDGVVLEILHLHGLIDHTLS